jgi:hypothetical protein
LPKQQEKESSGEEPSRNEVQRHRILEQVNIYLNQPNTMFLNTYGEGNPNWLAVFSLNKIIKPKKF